MAKPANFSFSNVITAMLVILLIAAASIGATLYYTTQTNASPAPLDNQAATDATTLQNAENTVIPAPIFVSLEPFTVTLRNERTSRILHVAITLRVPDERSRQILNDYMPEVRDRILGRLSEQHPILIQTPEGRAQLVQQLTTTLETPFAPMHKGPSIQNVLFTAFVVQ